MTHRTTKGLLLVIAVGLWMNIFTPWLQPEPVQAQFGGARYQIATDSQSPWIYRVDTRSGDIVFCLPERNSNRQDDRVTAMVIRCAD
jgi:hypothetical protein